METPSLSDIEGLHARLRHFEAASRRYQRQAALAISLLARDTGPARPAPLVNPVPIPNGPADASGVLRFNWEERAQDGYCARLSGWAHVDTPDAATQPGEIVVLLRIGHQWWAAATLPVPRPDVLTAFALVAPQSLTKGFEAHLRLPRPRTRIDCIRIGLVGEARADFSGELAWE